MHPRLAIIIVSYNSRGDLEDSLGDLVRHAPASPHEIVVVDNASPDDTARYVRTCWPQVRIIDAGGNLGFARANNLGIRQTAGDLVLLLNPDTRVPAGAIDRLVTVLDADPGVTIVGPRLVDEAGAAELSFGPMISPLAELRQKALVRGHARGIPPIRAWVERATRRARTVDWVSGACLLIRRGALEAVGLLDERFFMYTEDVDLCASVRARGGRVLFFPDVTVTHRRGRSVASAPRATEAAYRRSQIAFYEKHLPAWLPVLRVYLKIRGRLPDTPIAL